MSSLKGGRMRKISKKKTSSSSIKKPEVKIPKDIHDLTVKKVCEDKGYATDILKLVLTPREFEALDWKTLDLQANTFINEKLREDRTDLIFSVKFKKSKKSAQIVFLIEHKSYNDPHIMDQILRYQAASYRRTKAPILPIIIYNGKKKEYKGNLSFYGYLESCPDAYFRRSLSKNVLNFRCRMLNLRELSVQKMPHLTPAPILFILGNIWEVNMKVIETLFRMTKKLPEKKDRVAIARLAINYAMAFDERVNKGNRKLRWKLILEVEQKVFGEEESMIQSFNLLIEQVAEKKGLKKGIERGRGEGLEEGIERGRGEGREEGREETQREIALSMLKKGIKVSDISEITGISKDEIKALQSKKTS